MTQYEQENDLGRGRRGGGEVDEETLAQAWRDAGERRGRDHAADDVDTDAEHGDDHGDEQA